MKQIRSIYHSKKVIPLLFLFILLACSGKKDFPVEKKEMEKEVLYPKELENSLHLFPTIQADYNIDHSFLSDSVKNHKNFKLNSSQVQFLSSVLKENNDQSNSYYLKGYYEIETAKKERKYTQFLETLDIGMMKDANCFAIGKIEFGDSMAILLWKIEYSSYEACPFFQGTRFYSTLVAEGKVKETIQLASKESTGDAPMFSETHQDAFIQKNGYLKYHSQSKVFEDDLEVEYSEDRSQFKITTQGFTKK